MSIDTQVVSASQTTSANTPAATRSELRHITSIPTMAMPMKDRTSSTGTDKSGKVAQPSVSVSPPTHRMGSRSPTSIPSSPTSVHSSSSAIFERDIEPSVASSTHLPHLTNPHRTPRSKMSEALDQSVPSVLDSAAELLTAPDELEETQISVVAPTSRVTSGIGSPIGHGSRSPSPTRSAGNRTSMLLNLPSPTPSATIRAPAASTGSPTASGSPPRPTLHAYFAASSGKDEMDVPGGFPQDSSSTPTSAVSTQYESAASSPTTTTVEHPPQPLPTTSPSLATSSSPIATSYGSQQHAAPSQQLSHPPSPSHAASKRLSFISYNDLLASTPTSTLPLSSLTCPVSADPPPHLPSVSLSLDGGSAVGSAAVSIVEGFMGMDIGAADVRDPRRSILDDVGGEWEREGLGRGLEERLEVLMAATPAGGAASASA